jgi:hypothetical protein
MVPPFPFAPADRMPKNNYQEQTQLTSQDKVT